MTTTDARAMDARVHEFLTGEAIPCVHETVSPVAGSLVRCDGCGEEFGTTTLAMARNAWPRYSTDIAAAWEVADKMADDWPEYFVHKRDGEWMVTWGFDGYGYEEATAPTAPLAICRAALAALNEEA